MEKKIETNSNNLGDDKTTLFKLINLYIIDVFELVIVLYIFNIITGKSINPLEIIKTSLLLGIIMTMLNCYNNDLNRAIKMGIMGTIGGKVLDYGN